MEKGGEKKEIRLPKNKGIKRRRRCDVTEIAEKLILSY